VASFGSGMGIVPTTAPHSEHLMKRIDWNRPHGIFAGITGWQSNSSLCPHEGHLAGFGMGLTLR
jgi:hypothetical protein